MTLWEQWEWREAWQLKTELKVIVKLMGAAHLGFNYVLSLWLYYLVNYYCKNINFRCFNYMFFYCWQNMLSVVSWIKPPVLLAAILNANCLNECCMQVDQSTSSQHRWDAAVSQEVERVVHQKVGSSFSSTSSLHPVLTLGTRAR